jgi:hypothetical protein
MILAMKTSLINKTDYIRVFSTLILRCSKEKTRFAKEFQILSSTWKLLVKLLKMGRSNSSTCKYFKKNDIMNLMFEFKDNIS